MREEKVCLVSQSLGRLKDDKVGGLTTAAANKGKFSIPLVWMAANRLLQQSKTARKLGVSQTIIMSEIRNGTTHIFSL